MTNKEIKKIMNRAYQFVEEQQRALDEGKITEDQWYEIHKQFFTTSYLTSDSPRAQSGHSGDEYHYFHSHIMLLEAINNNGTFLDVGCANGYLLESLDKWIQSLGYYRLEFYGLDISEELIQLAKNRLPHWKQRLFTGNAFHWTPERKFDFVCVKELNYVPRDKQKAFFIHLIENYVEQGGRFMIGPYTEEIESSEMQDVLSSWGYPPTGFVQKSHQRHKNFSRKLLWLDN
ncbi:class I SAM-dependent methyltransferase [Paenibacillus ginsengarvi]|uniref:Methyltransferase domain-containing protein n=1 Tax=Paenibacillus ginsengarvi TaxID=400777 RepID=A0A3B0C4B7_9BACL|nr:class I SAM-dependent methyltransferase [Paenibacillus ginsengarvi]RKN80572.1 methyltransferase domain-containing protein [Paenibacillus ginsengarvi]